MCQISDKKCPHCGHCNHPKVCPHCGKCEDCGQQVWYVYPTTIIFPTITPVPYTPYIPPQWPPYSPSVGDPPYSPLVGPNCTQTTVAGQSQCL